MKKFITGLALCACMASSAFAAEDEPLWLRNSAISPDGSTVAFTFKGDIYTVPITGGTARQLTTASAHDSNPVWSNDGKSIAFSSDRKGSVDIYIVNAEGGTPTRLTTHSGSEIPLAFTPDGKVIFKANIMPDRNAVNGFSFTQLYTVPAESGKRPELLLSLPTDAVSVDAAGRILYQDKKGYEDRLRKHERSSGTSDIWIVENIDKPAERKFTKLTDFNGHSINPQWAGGDRFYYVSEESDGILNVHSRKLDGSGKRQITRLPTHPVRSLSASADGETIVFSYDGQLYSMKPSAQTQPAKIPVRIIRDDSADDTRKVRFTSGATDAALSPNGKEVAFVVRGDVFVTSVEYNTTRQITSTPGQERNVVFTPDGRSIIFDGERDGRWQIFQVSLDKPSDKTFTYAESFTEKPIVSTDKASQQPRVSPDGKKVAYLEDRTTLKVLDLATGHTDTAMDGKYAYSYVDGDLDMHWSPDSRWLLFDGYIGVGGWNNQDVAAVRADGSELVDLTESGYSDGNSKWIAGGKGVLYQSDRDGYRSHGSWGAQSDIYMVMLDGDAYERFNFTKEEEELAKEADKADKKDKADSDKKDKKDKKKDKKKDDKKVESKPLVFDFANRDVRRKRLTRHSSAMGDYFLTPEMDKLFYVARFEKGGDLWMLDLKKGDERIVAKDFGYGTLMPDSAGKKLFSLSNGQLKIFDTSSNDIKTVNFSAEADFSFNAERRYIFDHMKQQVQDKFYDANLHGVDWEMYTREYAKFLPYINNDDDFAELLSEVLGELNASHTGGRAYTSAASPLDATSYLGAFYSPDYEGDGLLISEVIARGPLALKSDKVKAGDIITAIDGKPIAAGADYFPLTAGKAGKRVRVSVRHAADGSVSDLTVKPLSAGGMRDLLYRRWVDRNKAVVDSVSGGKIGYVHISGMDSPSFRTIYDQVLGKYRNCDAIVVDTRYNGGGWLHNDVALLFSGKKYVDYSPRGQYIGSDPFSQWTKPSAMLINESNYSDAHGTPYVYKTLGIGKLVGAPVPGTMTAVWWENQVNPEIIFGIPQVTSLGTDGKPLENRQLDPDVPVTNLPADFLNGTDTQLIEATKLLMQK